MWCNSGMCFCLYVKIVLFGCNFGFSGFMFVWIVCFFIVYYILIYVEDLSGGGVECV